MSLFYREVRALHAMLILRERSVEAAALRLMELARDHGTGVVVEMYEDDATREKVISFTGGGLSDFLESIQADHPHLASHPAAIPVTHPRRTTDITPAPHPAS